MELWHGHGDGEVWWAPGHDLNGKRIVQLAGADHCKRAVQLAEADHGKRFAQLPAADHGKRFSQLPEADHCKRFAQLPETERGKRVAQFAEVDVAKLQVAAHVVGHQRCSLDGPGGRQEWLGL